MSNISFKEYIKIYNRYINNRKETIEIIKSIFQSAMTEEAMPKEFHLEKWLEISKYFRIFEKQIQYENSLDKKNKLRYFQNPYDMYRNIIFSSKKPEIILKEGILKIEEKDLEKMESSDLEKYLLQIEREEVILSAMNLNVLNILSSDKDVSTYTIPSSALNKKISEYIIKIIEYNSKVNNDEQIPFGFINSENNIDQFKLAFITNVPGYTRIFISLEIASDVADIISMIKKYTFSNEKAKEIAENFPSLDKDKHKYFRDAKYSKENQNACYYEESVAYQKLVYTSCKYPLIYLPQCINAFLMRNASSEEIKDREIFYDVIQSNNDKYNAFQDFIFYVKPNLNFREIIYLAERMEFSFEDIITMQELLIKRNNIIENTSLDPIENEDEIEIWKNLYIKRTIENTTNSKEAQKRVKQLFECYKIMNPYESNLDNLRNFEQSIPEEYRKFTREYYSDIIKEEKIDLDKFQYDDIYDASDIKCKKILLKKMTISEIIELTDVNQMSARVRRKCIRILQTKIKVRSSKNKIKEEQLDKITSDKFNPIFELLEEQEKQQLLIGLSFNSIYEHSKTATESDKRIMASELGNRILSNDEEKFDYYDFFIEDVNGKEQFNLNKFINMMAMLGKAERKILIAKTMIMVPEITGKSENEIYEMILAKIDKKDMDKEFFEALQQIKSIAENVSAQARDEAEREEQILLELEMIHI